MKKFISLCLAFMMLFSMSVFAESTTAITYTAPYAGIFKVSADREVTITNETGSTAVLTVGDEKYIYLIRGVNNIETTNADAKLTFIALGNNGMDYLNQIEVSVQPITPGDMIFGTNDLYKSLAPGETYTFVVDTTDYGGWNGIVYPYIWLAGPEAVSIQVKSDTGFYAELSKTGYANALYETAPDNKDMEFLYLRKGENLISITNTGSNNTTIVNNKMGTTEGLLDVSSTGYNWVSQVNVENLKPIPTESILTETGVNTATDELAFYGKVGANYMSESYGVEVSGTKFYGAKDGDTVSDDAEGTTTFTFGDWDGTFEIILTDITEKGTAGEKTYNFFVGDYVTDEAVVTVE